MFVAMSSVMGAKNREGQSCSEMNRKIHKQCERKRGEAEGTTL